MSELSNVGKIIDPTPTRDGSLQLSFAGGNMQYFVSHEDWVKTHGNPVKDQQVEIVFRKASESELKLIGQKDYEYYGFVPLGYKLQGDWFRK